MHKRVRISIIHSYEVLVAGNARPIVPRLRAEALSGNQHDLADVAPLGDEAVRIGRSVEREGLGDDRPSLPRTEPRYPRLDRPVEACLGAPAGERVGAEA